MSKLRDRIRRLGRQEAAPMGFARSASIRQAPGLLLLARIDNVDGRAIGEANGAGADGVLAGRVSGRKQQMPDDAWWGLQVTDGPSLDALKVSPPDFILVDQGAPIGSLSNHDLGLVVAVDESWPDSTVQALNVLNPDALYVRLGEDLTLRRLLDLRRLSALAGPLLLEVIDAPPSEALPLLRDAGVAGLVVNGAAPQIISSLREQVNAMPPRRRKHDEHMSAVLPRLDSHPADEEELS